MKPSSTIHPRAWLAGTLVWTALACGGSVGDSTKSDASSAGGPSDAPSSVSPAAGPSTAACDQYFAAQYSRCGGPVLPAAETARILARFERSCESEGALPGSGMTAATLAACTSALERYACESPALAPSECNFHGSLPGGAACTDGVQCASGRCDGTVSDSPEGPVAPFTCGTCAATVAVGQICNAAGCPADAICMTTDTTAKQPTYTCTALTEGALGAACDGLTALCEPGLYCSAQTKECTKLGGAGATCGEQQGQGSYPGGCVPPLGCASSMCEVGSAGAFCQSDAVCNAGLGCVPTPGSPSGACTPVTWASAGQPCSQSLVRCLVGWCNFGSSIGPPPVAGAAGTCPTVISDGQPCTVNDPSTTCDTFSECFQGKCAVIDSFVCK
jgi:hypothetical protein